MSRAAIIIPPLSAEAQEELETLYRQTRDVRVRSRAQMMLLSAEKQWVAREIAEIVRVTEVTVLAWLKRYLAEGVNGLYDAPRCGGPCKVTSEYKEQLLRVVRQRPRPLGQPYSMWTLQRLADYMAEQTGIRVSPPSIWAYLNETGIVLSRPQHKVSSPDPAYEVKKRRLKKRATS
jgi:transposase